MKGEVVTMQRTTWPEVGQRRGDVIAPWGENYCGVTRELLCTREVGHPGPHLATCAGIVMEIWL